MGLKNDLKHFIKDQTNTNCTHCWLSIWPGLSHPIMYWAPELSIIPQQHWSMAPTRLIRLHRVCVTESEFSNR